MSTQRSPWVLGSYEHNAYEALRQCMLTTYDKEMRLHLLRTDEFMLGCMTDQELWDKWYDGSTSDRSKQPAPAAPLFNVKPKTRWQAVMDYREECYREYGATRIVNDDGEIIDIIDRGEVQREADNHADRNDSLMQALRAEHRQNVRFKLHS